MNNKKDEYVFLVFLISILLFSLVCLIGDGSGLKDYVEKPCLEINDCTMFLCLADLYISANVKYQYVFDYVRCSEMQSDRYVSNDLFLEFNGFSKGSDEK